VNQRADWQIAAPQYFHDIPTHSAKATRGTCNKNRSLDGLGSDSNFNDRATGTRSRLRCFRVFMDLTHRD